MSSFSGFVVFDAIGDAEEGPELVPVLVRVLFVLFVDFNDRSGVFAAKIFCVVDVVRDVATAVPEIRIDKRNSLI